MMIVRLAALILLCAFCETTDLSQISMIVVKPGEDLNLTCPTLTGHKAGLFYWLKLKFGHVIQTIAAGSFENVKLEDKFKDSRFTVTFKEGLYYLSIRNASKEDEATYFCQAGSAYEMRVLNGTLVVVNDHKNHQNSVYVKQRPERQTVKEGHSVSLQCSLLSQHKETREQCPGEHEVYWLRAGVKESHPAVIYTSETRRVESDGRSCVYSLSKTIHNSSDAGTYYCAVATCGQILFGEGTIVNPEKEQQLLFIVLGILLLYSLFVTAALILYRNQRICKECKGGKTPSSQDVHPRTAEEQPDTESPQFNRNEQPMDLHSDGEEASLNYVALDFAARKAQRFTSIRESPLDCTYSSVGKRV